MKLPLYNIVNRAVQRFDRCAVAFSGGKDSVVSMDLCAARFKEVHAWFWYLVEGLEFQERMLRYYEQRFGIHIHRLPSPTLATMYQDGTFRPVRSDEVKAITATQYEDHIRSITSCEWLAYGYKAQDNFKRRGIIYGKGRAGLDEKYRRFYPVGSWCDSQIKTYCRQRKFPMETMIGQHGWGSLTMSDTLWLAENHPDDYQRALKVFPFLSAQLERAKLYASTPKV